MNAATMGQTPVRPTANSLSELLENVRLTNEEKQRQRETNKMIRQDLWDRTTNTLAAGGENYLGTMESTLATGVEALSRLESDAAFQTEMEVAIQRAAELTAERDMYIEESLKRGYEPDAYVLEWYDAQIAPLMPEAMQQDYDERKAAQAQNRADLYSSAAGHIQAGSKYREAAVNGLGTVGSFLVDAGIAGTQMLMDAGIGTITGTGSMAPMLVRSFGAGAYESASSGGDIADQLYEGTKSAAIEWVTEHLFGGNPIYDKASGWVNHAAKTALTRVLGESGFQKLIGSAAAKIAKLPAAMIEEGLEEVIGNYLDPWTDQLVDSFDGGSRYQPQDMPTKEENWRSFGIGALLALGGNAVTSGTATNNTEVPAAVMENYRAILSNATTEEIREHYMRSLRESGSPMVRAESETANYVPEAVIQNAMAIMPKATEAEIKDYYGQYLEETTEAQEINLSNTDQSDIFIGETSEKSSGQNAIEAAFASETTSSGICAAIIGNHEALGRYTPQEMKEFLESLGYDVRPLNQGNYKRIPFEEGGGYKINFGGDGLFQYHPPKRSHHSGEYWKVGNGEYGIRRYKPDGTEFEY